jgi:hypothetical protein
VGRHCLGMGAGWTCQRRWGREDLPRRCLCSWTARRLIPLSQLRSLPPSSPLLSPPPPPRPPIPLPPPLPTPTFMSRSPPSPNQPLSSLLPPKPLPLLPTFSQLPPSRLLPSCYVLSCYAWESEHTADVTGPVVLDMDIRHVTSRGSRVSGERCCIGA